MADIKVGIILDTPSVKAQAAKAGADIKREVEQGSGRTSKSSAQLEAEWRQRWTRQNAWVEKAKESFRRKAAANAEAASARSGMRQQMLSASSAFAGRFGLSGTGTAARAGSVGPAIAGVVAGLLALGKAIHETMQSIEAARQLYAKQLTSGGLPGSFVAKRSVLADIIGVGEQEVMQYGRAVEYLNDRIKLSVEDINRTNRTLTATSWNFRVLGLNLKAMWAEVAAALAPAMNIIANFTSAVVEFVRETGILEGAAQIARVGISVLAAVLGGLVGLLATVALAFVAIGDSIQYFIRQVNNSIARTMIGQKMGFKVDSSDPFKETKGGWEAIMKMMAAFKRGNADNITVPEASTSYKRMQVSPWEKMGLVIGGGIGSNPLRETARNTKAMVDILKHIKSFMIPRSRGNPKLGMMASPA